MDKKLYAPIVLAVLAALIMSIFVLPYGFALDTQLARTWSIIPLLACLFLAQFWIKNEPLQVPSGALWVGFAGLAALILNVIHASPLEGFAFGVLWLVAAGFVCLGRNLLMARNFSPAEARVGLEVFLVSLTLILITLTLPARQYLDLSGLVLVGPLHFPLTHGGFFQSNNFGSFIALVVGYSFWNRYAHIELCEQRAIKPTLAKVAIYVFFVFVVIQSDSRVGLLAILLLQIGWLIYGLLSQHPRIVKEMVWLTIIFIALINFETFTVAFSDAGGIDSPRNAFAGMAAQGVRISYWLSALLSQSDSLWLGSGFNSFNVVYPVPYQEDHPILASYPYISGSAPFFVHNELLNLWVAGGFFGLLFVGLPLLVGLWRLSEATMKTQQIGNLLPLLPLGLHCFTEFPLWQSGLHWLFLVLFLVVVSDSRTPIAVLNSKKFAVISLDNRYVARPVIGSVFGLMLLLSYTSIDLASVGHDAKINKLNAEDIEGVNEYAAFRAGHMELEHWAFTEGASHAFIRDIYLRALKEGRMDIVEGALPQIKENVKYNNTQLSWDLLAFGYAALQMRPQLIGFLDYVEKLDAERAAILRANLLK